MKYSTIIERQRAYFRTGATGGFAFRMRQLCALESGLERYEEAILAALHQDLRKSRQEAYVSEIGVLLRELRHAKKHLKAWMRPERRKSPWVAWPARTQVVREAYGVVLVVGPWNYPLQLLLAPLIGAIAAGNCAVLKPSEWAPATSAVIERMVAEVFADEYVAVVAGGEEVSKRLLEERWDKVFFTGGTEIGRAVLAATARHLTPVTLELGGKCPCVVMEDVPVEVAARRIVWGKMMNAGQTCVAPDHVWVEASVADELVAAMGRAIRAFYGENPQLSEDYGRIIHERHHRRLQGYLAQGEVVIGGGHDESDLYIEPTVLRRVARDAAVMREEIFGPILPVIEYARMEELEEGLAALGQPLAMYVFGRDRERLDRVIGACQSGSVCENDTLLQIVGVDVPFGGVGESGMGVYHGRASYECFSYERVVMRRGYGWMPDYRYPPLRISFEWLKRLAK